MFSSLSERYKIERNSHTGGEGKMRNKRYRKRKNTTISKNKERFSVKKSEKIEKDRPDVEKSEKQETIRVQKYKRPAGFVVGKALYRISRESNRYRES